jgi:ABC-2 type transport system permease protein
MLASIFGKTLYDVRRSLLGWGLGIAALVAMMAAVWPSIRDMPNWSELLKAYPEAMQKLFNIEAMTTPAGYLNAELFSIMLPALFIIFAVARGARLIAGEEENGTLEVVVATPVSRLRVLLDKAAALALAVCGLGALLFATTMLMSVVLGMDLGLGDVAVGSLAMVLLGIEHGWLALAVGAATGRRALAIGVASTVAVAGYVLFVIAQLVEAVRPWQPLSPFDQALRGGPLGGGLQLSFVWMVLAAVVFVAVAAPLFERRDIRRG